MQQNDSQLVIRDVPIFQWVFGILFGGVGTLVIGQGGPPILGGGHLCGTARISRDSGFQPHPLRDPARGAVAGSRNPPDQRRTLANSADVYRKFLHPHRSPPALAGLQYAGHFPVCGAKSRRAAIARLFFLASLGSMFIRQALSLHGFSPEDTPGLEQAYFSCSIRMGLDLPNTIRVGILGAPLRRVPCPDTTSALRGTFATLPLRKSPSGRPLS
jgi:hypothetical protein